MDIRDISDVLYLHRRRAIPAVVAVVLGVVAFVAFRSLVLGGDVPEAPPPPAPPPVAAPPPPDPEPEPVPPPAPVEIEAPETSAVLPTLLVSKRPIEAGDVLGDEHFEWREWPESVDHLDAVILRSEENANRVLGAIARSAFPAGVPITPAGIAVRGGAGFISSMLMQAMRAVTVEADRATTRAGLIHPGDRVDVILVSAGGEPQAQTIVRDVRVLAVGTALASAAPSGLGVAPGLGGVAGVLGLEQALAGAEGGGATSAAARGDTFTLEVSRTDADRLALAVNFGQITLALRGVAASESDGPSTEAVGLADLLVAPENLVLRPVRIIRGAGSATPSPSPAPPVPLFGS